MSNQPLVSRRRIEALKEIAYACGLTSETIASKSMEKYGGGGS